MYVIWVTPLSSRVRVHTLTYYTADDVPIGSVIDVPVRTKKVPALVLHRESVADVKTFLRRAGFSARRVSHTQPVRMFSPELMRAAEYTARFFACGVGSVIRTCVPNAVLAHLHHVPVPPVCLAHAHGRKCLQMSYTDRIDAYKTIIRETFALKQSVVLVAPTAYEAQKLYDALTAGIHKKMHVLHTQDTPTVQRAKWSEAVHQDGPILICTTPSMIGVPRSDIGLYIVEHASSQSYKRRNDPYIDMRVLIRAMAESTEASVLYADTFLPLEYHEQLMRGDMTEYDTIPKRITSTSDIRVIDMKAVHADIKARDPVAPFAVLAPLVTTAITDALAHDQRVFVLATRRGFAGTTMCDDCGTIVRCTKCDHPVALHTQKNVRVFLCHRCGESRSAKERCVHCSGWRLTPLGRGVERVEQALKHEFKKSPLFRIDTDTSPKDAAARITEWHTQGGILVGTERALNLVDTAYISVCASLDTLLSIPDFKIDERVFGLLLRMREVSQHALYVQTQQPNAPVLKDAAVGNTALFVRNELALREQLHYPPYTVIIKFTCTGTKTVVTKHMQSFAIALARHKPRIFGSFVHTGNQVQLSALLRIRRDAWPKKDIVEYARSLPPNWRVDVLPNRSDA